MFFLIIPNHLIYNNVQRRMRDVFKQCTQVDGRRPVKAQKEEKAKENREIAQGAQRERERRE